MKNPKINQPERFPLQEALMFELKKAQERIHDFGSLVAIYHHLFSLIEPSELETYLQYLKDVATGKDSYYKKSGKKEWFHSFHKSVRQTDFFNGVFRKRDESLTENELAEYRFLLNKVSKEEYVKESKVVGQLFNDEYKRFLDLSTRKRSFKTDKNVGGHIDMILWNMIHVDKGNELKEILERVFTYKLKSNVSGR